MRSNHRWERLHQAWERRTTRPARESPKPTTHPSHSCTISSGIKTLPHHPPGMHHRWRRSNHPSISHDTSATTHGAHPIPHIPTWTSTPHRPTSRPIPTTRSIATSTTRSSTSPAASIVSSNLRPGRASRRTITSASLLNPRILLTHGLVVLHLSLTHAAHGVGRSKGHDAGAAVEQVAVHALLAGGSGARVEEIDLAVPLGLAARLLIKEPDLLDVAVLDELGLQIRVRGPPVEVPHEQGGGAGPVAAPAVADHYRAAPVVGPSLAVEPVPSARLDLVVVGRRWRGGHGRLGWRREMGRVAVGAVHGGGGHGRDARDVKDLLRLPHGRGRGERERREDLGWRRLLLRSGLVLLGRQRRRLGRGRGLGGGVEEAVPDVDVVVEVVVVVVVAVVLVDVLHGGDGLLPVEGAVPVGIHRGGGGGGGGGGKP